MESGRFVKGSLSLPSLCKLRRENVASLLCPIVRVICDLASVGLSHLMNISLTVYMSSVESQFLRMSPNVCPVKRQVA